MIARQESRKQPVDRVLPARAGPFRSREAWTEATFAVIK